MTGRTILVLLSVRAAGECRVSGLAATGGPIARRRDAGGASVASSIQSSTPPGTASIRRLHRDTSTSSARRGAWPATPATTLRWTA